MKLLRKAIRKMILQEGMVTELGPDERAFIEYWNGEYHVKIVNDSRTIASVQLSPIANDYEPGFVDRDECHLQYDNTYLEIGPEESYADDGYGPLVYDIALEYAFQLGMYIVPDRTGVSSAASSMWKHYKEQRPDVRFTPFEEDHPCFFYDYDLDRQHLNGAYYKPNREYLDGLGVETPG